MAGLVLVFSTLRSTILRPLPYAQPESLVWVLSTHNDLPDLIPLDAARALRDAVRGSGEVSWYLTESFPVDLDQSVDSMRIARVEPAFFSVLGLRGSMGGSELQRLLSGSDVVVLSDRARTRLFPRGESAVEQRIRGGNRVLVVGGTIDQNAGFPVDVDGWTTIEVDPASDRLSGLVYVIARARTGVSVDILKSLLSRGYADWLRSNAPSIERVGLLFRPLVAVARPDLGEDLRILSAGIVAFFIIMNVNLANFFVLRAQSRRHEYAIRIALGASSGQLARERVTESAVLVSCGVLTGLLLIRLGSTRLPWLLPAALGRLEIELDHTILVATVAVAAVVAFTFALLPILLLSTTRPAASLGVEVTERTTGVAQSRYLFIGVQAALTSAIILAASVVGRTFLQTRRLNFGFQTHDIAFATVALTGPAFRDGDQARLLALRLEERLRGSPELRRVTVWGVTYLGRGWQSDQAPIQIEDRDLSRMGPQTLPILSQDVTPGFFAFFGIRILEGRPFNAEDQMGSAPVAIVSEVAARRLWPSATALGKQIRLAAPSSPWMTIVGVAANAQPIHPLATEWAAEGTVWPLLFRPLGQVQPGALVAPRNRHGFSVAARSPNGFRMAAATLASTIRDLVPGERVGYLGDLRRFVDRTDREGATRFEAAVFGVFGLVGIILSTMGIIGLIDEVTMRRTREIAIRVALGASHSSILLFVGRGTLVAASVGSVAGIVSAWVSSGVILQWFFGADIRAVDALQRIGLLPVVLVAAITAAFGVVVALLRARRALAINPAQAMRLN